MKKTNHTKPLLYILAGMVVVMVLALGPGLLRHRSAPLQTVKIDGLYLAEPRSDIRPFSLTDTAGRPFTQESLKGHWTMLFFGFTNCGMVCPTTMAALKGMMRQLEAVLPKPMLPQVVMISVDPERDNAARLAEYVHSFHKNFIGARADIATTIALEKDLHIAAAKIQAGDGKNGHYTIDHSSEILLFNPAGQLQAYLSWPHESKQMAQDYRAVLNAAVS